MDPWVTVPSAALIAYRHRAEILSIWNKITALVSGRDSTIAITGMAGVGKSVLFDHVSGAAYSSAYSPPGRSRQREHERVKHEKSRYALSVVPGQTSPQRHEALELLFEGKKPVDGILHVVCNGFTSYREDDLASVIEGQRVDNLQEFRQQQLAAEIVEFRTVSEHLRRSVRRHRNRPWIVVAVDKLDLFASDSDRTAARHHYGMEGGAFYEEIRLLSNQIGLDNLSLEVVPVCAWLEDFRFKDEVVRSELNQDQRNGLILNLLQVIQGLAATRP